LLKRIKQLHTLDGKGSIITLARSGRNSLGITGNEWDPDPLLLGCRNGVIDLKSGIFRAGSPDDFINLHNADPLPHSRTVTSDSISAWVAELVQAPKLVLLKPVDDHSNGIGRRGGHDGSPGPITLEQLAAWEMVDPYLAAILAGNGLDLWIINGNTPGRLKELLVKGTTRGIRLQR